jgi:phosphatidylserine/phosphatidylglycerophosphate/cardiolipin synthase-like enzyme
LTHRSSLAEASADRRAATASTGEPQRDTCVTMTSMARLPGILRIDRWDDWVGERLEQALRHHHHRRLRKLGWDAALQPEERGWWSPRAEVRPGNDVEILIDGVEALASMQEAIRGAQESVHIAGWHASPDFRLTRDPDSPKLRDLLADVANRVPVRLLLWAGPPLPAFEPTRKMVKAARDEFERDSDVQCALDNRERTMHCHHEKIVIIDGTTAYVGGIDFTALQGDRHDHPDHPPRGPLGWHDAAMKVRGPAVADVATHFTDRWNEVTGQHIPTPPIPPPQGSVELQVLRTVPEKTYKFLPKGEFSILDAYLRALRTAEHLIYLENQFLWSPEVVDVLTHQLEHPPNDDFRILLLLPTKPSNGRDTTRGQISRLVDADSGNERLLATTISANGGDESSAVYVHAKIGIIDDRWLTIGSGNLNEHSLFNDTEMNVLTCDRALAHETRLRLWAEHTERSIDEVAGEPHEVIDNIWRPTAEEQSRLDDAGMERTHRLTLLPQISRRTDRLEGPMRGLLVDG